MRISGTEPSSVILSQTMQFDMLAINQFLFIKAKLLSSIYDGIYQHQNLRNEIWNRKKKNDMCHKCFYCKNIDFKGTRHIDTSSVFIEESKSFLLTYNTDHAYYCTSD